MTTSDSDSAPSATSAANVVDAIGRARTEKKSYTDFADFLRKVDAVACNRKVVESLITAGAFDSLGHPRKGLYLVHGEAIDVVMESKRAEAIGQFDLFGGQDGATGLRSAFDVSVPAEHWDTKHQLALEREMLGLYVSGHPLRGVEHILAPGRTLRSRRSWMARSPMVPR